MNISISNPDKNKIDYGCVLHCKQTGEAFLIVNREGLCEDYPVVVINLTTSKVYDEYDSLISVEQAFSDSVVYQPHEIYLGIGE